VLVERGGKGHAENFAPVLLCHPRESGDPAGISHQHGLGPRFREDDSKKVVPMNITGVRDDALIGDFA
jgi:hypothetical protein